ncbi:kyphoscoliosis peptidase-like [Tropilaelaps mercedesae]|uniref:Kyphoscoliosis peptidase-like n=1 Tax=Tropilaelaps mercedesae TaxID=418985 RepID=A0A1V9XPW1_9ACAR|nr:kyphoscoliosis peptidase-like [Tropilaelaps mercedesae]
MRYTTIAGHPRFRWSPGSLRDAETQRTLEMRHRMEEDDLYRQFAKKRVEEENVIQHQIREEWEKELEKLTSRYHQEIRRKRNNFAVTPDEERAMTMRHQKDKDDLEKNMTVKLDRSVAGWRSRVR